MQQYKVNEIFGKRVIVLNNGIVVRREHSANLVNFVKYLTDFDIGSKVITIVLSNLFTITNTLSQDQLNALKRGILPAKPIVNKDLKFIQKYYQSLGYESENDIWRALLKDTDSQYFDFTNNLPELETLPSRLQMIYNSQHPLMHLKQLARFIQ